MVLVNVMVRVRVGRVGIELLGQLKIYLKKMKRIRISCVPGESIKHFFKLRRMLARFVFPDDTQYDIFQLCKGGLPYHPTKGLRR